VSTGMAWWFGVQAAFDVLVAVILVALMGRSR
jgi:hypothetical protein